MGYTSILYLSINGSVLIQICIYKITTMTDNDSIDSDSGSDSSSTEFRYHNCVFNPTDLNTNGANAHLYYTSSSEYLTNMQLKAKVGYLDESFSIFHTNIRSVQKHFDELTILLNDINFKF